jgi:hypothetical protein
VAELLDYIRAAIGIWLAAIAGILVSGVSALRICLAVASFLLMISATAGFRFALPVVRRVLRWLGILIGMALLAGCFVPFSDIQPGTRVNVLLVAILTCVVSIAALRVGGAARKFSLYAPDGSVLMEVTGMEFRGANLAVKGKMMGAMPAVALLRPSELRSALNCTSAAVLLQMFVMVFRALVPTQTAPLSARGNPH